MFTIKTFTQYLNEAASQTWTEVRDVLQSKKPFVLIVFRTRDSYLQYLKEQQDTSNQIQQVAFLRREDKKIRYPSVFLIMDREEALADLSKQLYSKYDIKLIIIGKNNSEYCELFLSDGSSSEIGNEVTSALSPSEFENEDFFKVGSTYYRFIDFQG